MSEYWPTPENAHPELTKITGLVEEVFADVEFSRDLHDVLDVLSPHDIETLIGYGSREKSGYDAKKQHGFIATQSRYFMYTESFGSERSDIVMIEWSNGESYLVELPSMMVDYAGEEKNRPEPRVIVSEIMRALKEL